LVSKYVPDSEAANGVTTLLKSPLVDEMMPFRKYITRD